MRELPCGQVGRVAVAIFNGGRFTVLREFNNGQSYRHCSVGIRLRRCFRRLFLLAATAFSNSVPLAIYQAFVFCQPIGQRHLDIGITALPCVFDASTPYGGR